MLDTTIHLGDVIATAAIGAFGLVARKAFKEVATFIGKLPALEERVEEHARVIDLHTAKMIVSGWINQNDDIPRLRRRKGDVDDSYFGETR